MIEFSTLKRRKETFARVTGVKLEYFWLIVEKVKPFWDKWLASKQCHGRNSHLKTLKNEILMVLIYYRCYISHFMLGMYFGLDASNVCRHLQRMEPMIAKAIHIKKDRTLTANNLHKILIDATEVQTQRHKGDFSGKKKRHTQKFETMCLPEGKIVNISKVYHRCVHETYCETKLARDEIKLAGRGQLYMQTYQYLHIILPKLCSHK